MPGHAFDPERLLADTAALVEVESPSDDAGALAKSADAVATLGTRLLGRAPERIGDNLRWTFGTPRVLLLGHHDTVWPLGTLRRWPFEIADGRATGPGCFDMKAGLAMALHAVTGLEEPDGVAILVTSDEEIGAPGSRDLILDTARGLDAALVTEPSADGAVKIARKGMRTVRLVVTGRASHAGLEPEAGVNAGVELAHHLVAIESWHRPPDTSLVPTLVSAGTTMNTVPATAHATFDLRSSSAAALDDVEAHLRELTPIADGATVQVEHVHGRGPLEEASSRDLFALARRVAGTLGIGDLDGVAVGGVSDGNLTASIDTPTLDGLGAVGGGAHAEGEWIEVASLADRTALLHGMVTALLDHGRDGVGEGGDHETPNRGLDGTTA